MERIVIKITKGKKHTAKSVLTGLCYAQETLSMNMLESEAVTPHDRMLALHTKELAQNFRGLLQKDQQKYTLKLTELQAEAFRQSWARIKLEYANYGAIQVQWVLDSINKVMPL